MSLDKPHSMVRDSETVQSEEASAAISADGESAGESKSFQQQVWELERQIITAALEETGGSVTSAARKLGLTHQGLCYIINFRHKELLAVRKPLRIRRSIITKGKTHKANRFRKKPTS